LKTRRQRSRMPTLRLGGMGLIAAKVITPALGVMRLLEEVELADKPGFVVGSHSSGTTVTRRL